MSQTAENNTNGNTQQPAAPVFTEEQVTQRVEAARQEEKKKLYGDIDSLTKRLSVLEPESARAQQLEAQLAEKTAALEAIAKARSENGNIDITKVIEETTERVRKASLSERAQEIEELRANQQNLREEIRKKELAAVRSQLLASYGDEIIPSLVVGNDEESLRASATASHEQYKAIAARTASRQAPAAPNANGGLPPPAGATSRAGTAPASGSQLDGFKRGGDYAARRNALMAELKAKHG